MTINIGPPDERKPWSDDEIIRVCDWIIRHNKRVLQDAQDAEAKRAAAKEKRERNNTKTP